MPESLNQIVIIDDDGKIKTYRGKSIMVALLYLELKSMLYKGKIDLNKLTVQSTLKELFTEALESAKEKSAQYTDVAKIKEANLVGIQISEERTITFKVKFKNNYEQEYETFIEILGSKTPH